MRRACVVLAVLALLTAFVPPPDYVGPARVEVLERTNHYRAAHGLRPLVWGGVIAHIAQRHAAAMADRGALFHNPRLTHQAPAWRVLGENVGYGPTVRAVHRAFVASPDHRDNLAEPAYRRLGVGVARTPGRVWVVVVFRDPARARASG